MKRINPLVFTILICIFYGCADIKQKDNSDGMTIDFGNLKSVKSSDIIAEHTYIKLESSDSSLLGSVNQIEISGDRIYILDRDKTNSIFVFSMQGKFVQKLEAKGNGPGEFIAPQSFKIDSNGYIYVLDRVLNRLLKYQLRDRSFCPKRPVVSSQTTGPRVKTALRGEGNIGGFYVHLPRCSLPVCRSSFKGGRNVRATQGTILLNGKLSARVE